MASRADATPGRPVVPGDALPTVSRTITQGRIDAYRQASGDNNPLHFDADFAASTRFGGIIAHGMLTLALVSEMMAGAYGADWLASGGIRVRFRGAAYPGDRLESAGTVSKIASNSQKINITCQVSVRNPDTDALILSGTATVVTTP